MLTLALGVLPSGCGGRDSGGGDAAPEASRPPAMPLPPMATPPSGTGWTKIFRRHALVTPGSAPSSDKGSVVVVHGDGSFELALPGASVRLGRLSDEEYSKIDAAIAATDAARAVPPASCAGYDLFSEDPVFATEIALSFEQGSSVKIVEDDGQTRRICIRGETRSALQVAELLDDIVSARR